MDVFEKITGLQAGKEGTAPWTVGQQLKDICRNDTACAAMVLEDLESEAMSLEACEKQIAKWAGQQRKKGQNCVCVTPEQAERIIREFYGLPEAQAAPKPVAEQKKADAGFGGMLSLEDLLG